MTHYVSVDKHRQIVCAHLREERWRILESENPDWDRWNEIEDELNALEQVDE